MMREPITGTTRLTAAKSFLSGQKMGQLWDQVQEWRRSQPSGKTWFGRGVEASYAINQWFDDFYRTATSLEALDKAGKAGKVGQAAELEAIRAVRSVMQNWDELLPLERSILRSVFPFYSWARFSLGFVMRYPMDHPLRAAFMASFARNEMEDRGTGLPEKFNGLFQLSGMDEDGNARFLRMSGMNPFRDVSDWMTLSGIVGNVNPVVSATLLALGVEPAQGGPMLYPTLRYDPETGGLKADTPSFLPSLITSTLPQARLIQNLIGGNSQFTELLQRDPEAARQQLLGQMGLPVMVQTENIPQEQFRAELNRYEDFQIRRKESVAAGDWNSLESYPEALPVMANGMTLGVYLDQLNALQASGGLDAFRPQVETPSTGELLRSVGGYTGG
jgi:hypothetical protein